MSLLLCIDPGLENLITAAQSFPPDSQCPPLFQQSWISALVSSIPQPSTNHTHPCSPPLNSSPPSSLHIPRQSLLEILPKQVTGSSRSQVCRAPHRASPELCQVSVCSCAPSSPDCQPLPAHLLSSGWRSPPPPPRSIPAPSGRIRDCKDRLRAEDRLPAALAAGAPGAPSGQERHHAWWAQNHALHPGSDSTKECCLSCRSTLATPTSGSTNYNSQLALRRSASPGMHCLTQSQAELTRAHSLQPRAGRVSLGRKPGLKGPAGDSQECESTHSRHTLQRKSDSRQQS